MNKEKENIGEFCMGGWHLKKEVTIGQLLTILVLSVSGIWWASSVETRINGLHLEDKRIEEKTDLILSGMTDRFDRYQSDVAKAMNKIDMSINRLSDKIDQKADK